MNSVPLLHVMLFGGKRNSRFWAQSFSVFSFSAEFQCHGKKKVNTDVNAEMNPSLLISLELTFIGSGEK